MRALSRRYAGTLHGFRLECLGERLRTSPPMAVRHNTCGFAGDRWRIELDDGRVLTMKLYWPQRASVAALCALDWHAGEGWRATVRVTDGRRLTVRAFQARLSD